MTRYEAVVFDNDGVLVHPTADGVLRRAVRRAYEGFGVDPDEDAVAAGVSGDRERIREACAATGIDPDAFWPERESQAARLQRAAMEAGDKPVYDDVTALADLDRPLGVVSNNQHETVEAVLDVHGLGDLFATAYGREPSLTGLARKKPESHYVERAFADLGVDPTDALYVGDSEVDVLAAAAAGADSAFVRRPHRVGYELGPEPTHAIETLADLRRLV